MGCIPSKSLLHATRVGVDDPLAWTRDRRDRLHDHEDEEMEHHEQIVLLRGWARLTDRRDPHVVSVTTASGDEIDVRAEHVIVAAGSQPVRLAIEGLPDERIVTNEELFELPELPRKVLLVGGGPIALEMATAFRDAGGEVVIVELQDRLLATEHVEVGDTVRAALEARGIAIHLGTSVERFDEATTTAHLADGTTVGGVDLVVMAVGRRPNLERLELDAAGVEHTPRGIVADDWGRTSVDGIWAIGDITGNTLTTHGANAIGRRTVRAIALPRLPKTGDVRAMPNATYSRPEIATVGRPLDQIEKMSPSGRRRYLVELADLDRGHTDDVEHGLVVVDVERFTGTILRAAIVGPSAAELIGIFTVAIDHGIGLRKLFGMIHPYPAYAEAIGRLADDFARDTYPKLPAEWWAMVRGRLANRLRR